MSSGKSILIDARSGKISIGDGSSEVGSLDYNVEYGWGDSRKVYLNSSGALKLQAGNGISLNAGSGDVWIYGTIRLAKNGAQILDSNDQPINSGGGTAKFG